MIYCGGRTEVKTLQTNTIFLKTSPSHCSSLTPRQSSNCSTSFVNFPLSLSLLVDGGGDKLRLQPPRKLTEEATESVCQSFILREQDKGFSWKVSGTSLFRLFCIGFLWSMLSCLWVVAKTSAKYLQDKFIVLLQMCPNVGTRTYLDQHSNKGLIIRVKEMFFIIK